MTKWSRIKLATLVCSLLFVPLAQSERRGHGHSDSAGFEDQSGHISRLLFLNRCAAGCTIGPGYNDASLNTSAIVDSLSSVSPWTHGDVSWSELVTCVKEIYAPYDIDIVDVDPGANVSHNEAIVAGFASEIGWDGVLGVAPSRCEPYNNAISFTFASEFGNDPLDICHTVAQETAHAYGLEHSLNCSDPMTYLPACGRQFFRDEASSCGEYEVGVCRCGGSVQNTHTSLLDAVGPNSTPVPGPEVVIQSPAEGEAVSDGFVVTLLATHMRGVKTVMLFLNGEPYGQEAGHAPGSSSTQYQFTVPADLPDGVIDIEIRAELDIGSVGSTTITVQKGEPCTTEATCYAKQECSEGRCMYPPADGDLGDRCTADRECLSGLCSIGSEASYCSKPCLPPPATDSCPDAFTCVEVGPNSGHCRPTGGCGCQSSGSNSFAGALLFLLLMIRLRRRA